MLRVVAIRLFAFLGAVYGARAAPGTAPLVAEANALIERAPELAKTVEQYTQIEELES